MLENVRYFHKLNLFINYYTIKALSCLYCRTTSNLLSYEDNDEHVEEVEHSVTTSDNSQNMSQGNRKETKVTPQKCRCRANELIPWRRSSLYSRNSTKEGPKYDAEDVSCLSLVGTVRNLDSHKREYTASPL